MYAVHYICLTSLSRGVHICTFGPFPGIPGFSGNGNLNFPNPGKGKTAGKCKPYQLPLQERRVRVNDLFLPGLGMWVCSGLKYKGYKNNQQMAQFRVLKKLPPVGFKPGPSLTSAVNKVKMQVILPLS